MSQGDRQGVSSAFLASTLKDLPDLRTEDLNNIEKKLRAEFKSAGREYVVARLARIKHILDHINDNVKIISENDKSWKRIYDFESDTIKNMKTNTEDYVLSSGGHIKNRKGILKSIEEYEEEFKEIQKNLQSPLKFDSFLSKNSNLEEDTMPFQKHFGKVLEPYRRELEVTSNEMEYQEELISANVRRNHSIIWKQYYNDLINRKNQLINATQVQLNELYKDYHNINSNKRKNQAWAYYYRSLISPSDLKSAYKSNRDTEMSGKLNHDHFYDTDNAFFPKNKVELTDAKYRNLKRVKAVEHLQGASRKRMRVEICEGLSDDEIENDLHVMRNVKTTRKATGVNAQDQIQAKPELERQQIRDQTNETENKGEYLLYKKYRELLGFSSSKEYDNYQNSNWKSEISTEIPRIPPIEKFPNLS